MMVEGVSGTIGGRRVVRRRKRKKLVDVEKGVKKGSVVGRFARSFVRAEKDVASQRKGRRREAAGVFPGFRRGSLVGAKKKDGVKTVVRVSRSGKTITITKSGNGESGVKKRVRGTLDRISEVS